MVQEGQIQATWMGVRRDPPVSKWTKPAAGLSRVTHMTILSAVTCVVNVFGIGPARWPSSPSSSEPAQGFNLIQVSGVGEEVCGVSEVAKT